MKIKIYVEGKTDKRFIEQYLIHLGFDSVDVIDTGGKDKLKSQVPILKTYVDEGYQILVIFDADDNIKLRRKDLEEFKNKNQLVFDIFLFPNNINNGEIEDMLFEIINTENKSIFKCFDSFNQCLEDKYHRPNKEAKIYAYLDALTEKNNKETIRPEKRLYLKSEHWNLNSEYLNPLKEFLLKYNI